jgi:hypothetical protein
VDWQSSCEEAAKQIAANYPAVRRCLIRGGREWRWRSSETIDLVGACRPVVAGRGPSKRWPRRPRRSGASSRWTSSERRRSVADGTISEYHTQVRDQLLASSVRSRTGARARRHVEASTDRMPASVVVGDPVGGRGQGQGDGTTWADRMDLVVRYQGGKQRRPHDLGRRGHTLKLQLNSPRGSIPPHNLLITSLYYYSPSIIIPYSFSLLSLLPLQSLYFSPSITMNHYHSLSLNLNTPLPSLLPSPLLFYFSLLFTYLHLP